MTDGNVQTRGRFIAIEGVDGAGKGVQSRLLRDALRNCGVDVLLTREPGGSPGAEQIRSLLVTGAADRWDSMTELLLIYAARRSHLQQTILPALAKGTWVISDRFADSSRAFQGLAGGLGLDVVERIHREVVGDFNPDLVLVLDLDPATSLARAKQRGDSEDRFEKKGENYQRKVRDGFRLLAQRSPVTHRLIDAGATVEMVAHAIKQQVAAALALPALLVSPEGQG
ncbi:MAG TPA: dTMP kinase [Candidatus Acidoferrum sp.]|nr:dTMP kinase [Candidatus Acidoferrum sp.]